MLSLDAPQNPQHGETKVVKGGVSPSFEGEEGTFAFSPRKFLRFIKKERVSVNIIRANNRGCRRTQRVATLHPVLGVAIKGAVQPCSPGPAILATDRCPEPPSPPPRAWSGCPPQRTAGTLRPALLTSWFAVAIKSVPDPVNPPAHGLHGSDHASVFPTHSRQSTSRSSTAKLAT